MLNISEVIIKLVKLVKKEIKIEMQGRQEFVVYDGCTCNNTPYNGVYASVYGNEIIKHSHIDGKPNALSSTLLALSRMSQQFSEEHTDAEDKKATFFNATVHGKLFQDVFKLYGQSFDNWCICLTASNTSTIPKLQKCSTCLILIVTAIN